MRVPAPIDHAARWRPVVPAVVVDRALRRMRGGMVTNSDGTTRPLNFSERAIDRTRVLMHRQQTLLDPPPRALTREPVTLPQCGAQWLRMPESRSGYVLLYFHGGAYLRGSTDTHIGALARFMRAGAVEALSVDYRMEPQHRFPAWIDDAVSAYRYLLDHGTAPDRIALGGDSAGGGIAMALVQRIAELGLAAPACVTTISPWVDLTCSGPSHTENVDADAMFGPGVIDHTAQWLAGQAGVPRDHPLLSPAFGSYVNGPPLRIDASAVELLRSDAERLAEAYRRDGASVDLVIHPTAPHAWTAIGGLRAARSTARDIGAFVQQHLT
jgi:monoterpene epsilon-lactone hydrolase